ncbi:MAG: nucleotidyltransferase family protein [Herbiconiux sp.]|nr:nucleotidyltransferase family protein [Herbiconiux sp.]
MDDSREGQDAGAAAVLRPADAIPLGSALISHVAEQAGIRALVIKGLVVEQLGLRRPRQYADIDVLVEPARFDDLVRELGARGWHERVHFWMFDHIDEHSMTLIHPSWPVDIDLHRHFPGFLAPKAAVFDELWQNRAEFTIAGRPVLGTDEPASAAVLALHALRWMHTARNVTEYAYLIEQLRERPETGRALAELAARTGSSETLRSVLDELGIAPVAGRPVSSRALKAWRRRISHPSRTGQWFTYLQSLPVSRWPRELRAVVWPPAELFLQEHSSVPNTPRALFAGRVRRLRKGMLGLPRVIAAGFRKG